MIVHQHSLSLVGLCHHATVILRADNARAHREGPEPREEHHQSAEYDRPDERQQADEYYDVNEGATILGLTTRFGNNQDARGERVPRPVSLHTGWC
jgi:hypothetical protein